ncbi:MAG: DUF427 domain-containing protein [Proteobacteria bacterium]|nr:DUF427 domain-containing protein [Pseudomonadota bacterium]
MAPPRRDPVGPGQESVWDYPRPPRLEPDRRLVEVVFNGHVVARTTRALRLLETSHPPTWYIPPDDIDMSVIEVASGSSFCEWKGVATYHTVVVGSRRAERAAWSYASPAAPFEALADHLAFYVAAMDACTVGGERARPQPGGFYGGWVTSDLAGPFKGEPGTWHW